MIERARSRLATELDLLRRGAGLSVRQLGKRASCPPSTLNDALSGRRFPRLETVLAIARACGSDEGIWRDRWVEADLHRQGRGPDPVPTAPAELPHDVRGFAGRAAELERLRELRTDGTPSICVIHGMAGVGKTALALHWAHRIAERFPDGQLFVDLRGHHPHGPPLSPAEALDRLMRSLGAPPERIPAEAEDAARGYRSLLAGRRVLIVLDDATSADQVRPLLPGGGGCQVIVTSRRKLAGLHARDGAYHLRLDVLEPGEARTLLANVLGRDPVDVDPAAADELARVCGHLPLALRIAAAHLGTGPYQRIAELVGQLTGGDPLRDPLGDLGADDHTGVRLAFDLSYHTLDADAGRLFRRLGLAPGSDITAEAAARLIDAPAGAAAVGLAALDAAHLLDQPVPGRYRMHDLLHRYAAERAEAEEAPAEREAARVRLLHWYLSMVDAAASRLYPDSLRLAVTPPAAAPFAADADALSWLETELPNLGAAVRHAARHGPPTVAWLLADGLRGFFNLRLHRREWFDSATAGLDAAERHGDRRAEAAMHHSLGLAHSRLGSNTTAVDHFSRALVRYRELETAEGTATVLICLGGVHRQLGQTEQAAACFRQALEVCRELRLHVREAACLGDLGEVYRDQGNLVEARRCQQQAVRLFRRLAVPRGEALALLALGTAHHQLGQPVAALECQTRALVILRAIGCRDGEAYAMLSLAGSYNDTGEPEQAGRYAAAALALATELGDDTLVVEARLATAAVLRGQSDPREAARQYYAALRLARGASYRHGEAKALAGLASAEACLGEHDRALVRCRRAMALSKESGYRLVEADVLSTLADAYHRAGHDDQAYVHCRQAIAIHRQTGHRPGETHALGLLSRIRGQAGASVPGAATA